MEIQFRGFGIYLPEIDLWLDSSDLCSATWISHEHGCTTRPRRGYWDAKCKDRLDLILVNPESRLPYLSRRIVTQHVPEKV